MEREAEVLPELEAEIKPRPLRRQPAFLVSMGLALVAVLVCGGLVIRHTMYGAPDRVENVTLRDTGDNYLLEWDGPDVPYHLDLTTADGAKPEDVSGLLRSWEAWVPKDGLGVAQDSCLVIRPQETEESEPFTVDAQELEAQGGAIVCVADAEDA